MWFGSMLAAVCVARVRNWALRSSWLVVVFSVAVTSSSVSWSVPARGLVVSASASVLVGREFSSAGSNQDLVNWYCSLLTRRTVYGRAAGNSPRTTTTKINKWNDIWNCRNSVVALLDHCSYKALTTNHHIKQVGLSMFASCQFTFCSCFIRCRVSVN